MLNHFRDHPQSSSRPVSTKMAGGHGENSKNKLQP